MKKLTLIFATFCTVACLVQPADASLIVMDVSQVISGGTPSGSGPWLQAEFDDHDTPGIVTLTVQTMNLLGDEFISDVYFNLDPAMDPAKLQFSSLLLGGTFAAPTMEQGANASKAGGDGYFDLVFQFATANADRFAAGDAYQITVTSTDPITASSFNFPSSTDKNGSGETPYYSAAHLQSFEHGTKSIWTGSFQGVPVPEPSTTVLAILGLIGGGFFYRGKKR